MIRRFHRLARLLATTFVVGPLGVSAPLHAQRIVDLPARDRTIEPALSQVFRVGGIDGATWQLFGSRIEVAFDGAGNLYVFDPQNFRVVVASPTGAFLRSVGTRGEGPGELRSPSGFAVMQDGTVVIADLAQRSFLLYGPDGAHRRSVSFASGPVVSLGALLADPRGGSIVSSGRRTVMMTAQGGAPPPSMPEGRPILRYPLDEGSAGRQIHTGWDPAAAAPATVTTAPAGAGRGTVMTALSAQRAFEPALFAGVLPDGRIAVSDSSAYAIEIVGANGGVESVLRRAIRPRAVTARIQEEERERRLAEFDAGGGPQVVVQGRGGAAAPSQADVQAMLRRGIEQLQFYPEVPVVTALAVGWAGKIWVGRRGEDLYEPGPVDVLTPTGEYLGTIESGVAVPSAFGPNGLAAFVERDALDVLTVVVRRLPAELR